MHYSRRLGLIAGALALTSAIAFAEDAQAPASQAPASPTKPIVVNGVTISPERFDFLIREMTNAGQPDSPELRENVRRQLIDSVLLSQQAVKAGLDKEADVQARLELSRQGILARAQVGAWMKSHPVTDEVLKSLYEKKKPELTSKETKVRHILVDTEKQANKILADLKKGKKFEDLAKLYTKDEGSKATGGDLGWMGKGLMRASIEKAALALKPGQVSAPLETDKDVMLIQLVEAEEDRVKPFEDVKQQILEKVREPKAENAKSNYLNGLRTRGNVRYLVPKDDILKG